MKKKYKVILIAGIVLLSMIGFGWSKLQPKTVEAETLAAGNLETVFTVQGKILPENSQILNAGSTGVVQEIICKAGDTVPKDTVLVRLGYENRTDLEIQREQYRQQLTTARQTYDRLFGAAGTAAAGLETAKKDYNLAEKNYQNGKTLAGQSISQMDLTVLENLRDKAKQALVLAEEEASENNQNYYKQQISSYEKQLQAIEAEVAPGEITMPYDGVVWEVYPETGGYVVVNQPVAKIYEPGNMKIQLSLLTEDAVWMQPGQTVFCQYADGTRGEAKVQFVSVVAGQTISTIGMEENRSMVECKPLEIPANAGAGHQVDVTCSLIMASGVLSVPSSALIPTAEGTGVYVIKNKTLILQPVETGERTGGRVEIKTGLEEGDVIVTDPYEDNVKEGQRVRVLS